MTVLSEQRPLIAPSPRAADATVPRSRWAVLIGRLRRGVLVEFGTFGVIGGVNAVLEVVIFTALQAEAHMGPLTSKLLSFIVTSVLSYYMNRMWTWRSRPGRGGFRDLAEFVVISAGGLLLAEGCLGISHYLLGLQTLLADNISGNVVGLALGTAWRFWASRRWVFTQSSDTA